VKRRLFTLGSAVSLVMCVAVCVFWVRSYWRRDGVTSFNLRLDQSIWSNRGVVVVFHRHPQIGPLSATDEFPTQWEFKTFDPLAIELFFGPPRSIWNRAGFRLFRDEASVDVMFPHWSLALLLLVLPSFWYARGRGHPEGKCAHCGYDLRATPDRCPECGTTVQTPQH